MMPMRGADFVATAILINDAASEAALRRVEARLRAAELAGEGDRRTRVLLERLARRRHELGARAGPA
jgi:hypothetical protein